MTLNPRRFVKVVEARNGGFSQSVLPIPVQYAGPPPEPVVIYWTPSGPAANVEGAIIEYFDGPPTRKTHKGQPAITTTSEDIWFGEVRFNANLLDLYKEFTLELWAETTGLDQGDPAQEAFMFVALSRVMPDDSVDSFATLVFDNYGSHESREDHGFAAIWDSMQINAPYVQYTNNQFNHGCIQRINDQIYVHLNGQPLSISNRTISAVFNRPTALYMAATGRTGSASIGQIRFTPGEPIYGIESFTPPADAFYTP